MVSPTPRVGVVEMFEVDAPCDASIGFWTPVRNPVSSSTFPCWGTAVAVHSVPRVESNVLMGMVGLLDVSRSM